MIQYSFSKKEKEKKQTWYKILITKERTVTDNLSFFEEAVTDNLVKLFALLRGRG